MALARVMQDVQAGVELGLEPAKVRFALILLQKPFGVTNEIFKAADAFLRAAT
jgi:hypothetical protein